MQVKTLPGHSRKQISAVVHNWTRGLVAPMTGSETWRLDEAVISDTKHAGCKPLPAELCFPKAGLSRDKGDVTKRMVHNRGLRHFQSR